MSGTSCALRLEILDALRVGAEASAALWYDAASDGLVDFAHVGAPDLPDRLGCFIGRALPDGAAISDAEEVRARRRGGWTIESAPSPLRAGFRTIADDFSGVDEFSTFPIWRDFYRPLGFRDHVRVLAYRGPRFLGWIGAFSTEGTFHRGVGRRLASMLHRTLEGLATARTLEALDDDAFLVFDGDGRVERGTERALAWLSRERGEIFARCVRAADRGEGKQFRVDGVSARLVRLAGGESVRYLAMLRDRDAIELRAEPRLSRTEQAVAEDLVAGLTVREVAALRGFAESTAKTHVKNIYRKLGVASRVELAEALRGVKA